MSFFFYSDRTLLWVYEMFIVRRIKSKIISLFRNKKKPRFLVYVVQRRFDKTDIFIY